MGLAQALKVNPGWLAHGDTGPAVNGSAGRTSSRAAFHANDVRWPFREVGLDDYLALSASEKRVLSGMVVTYIRTCQSKR